jgi:tetratricopeptide (TPR) repeat protein
MASALVASTLFAVCLTPRPARADAAQAKAHFEKGRTYYEVDQYAKAIEEFKAAHVERPDAAFLYNIAECYRRMNEPRDALVYYRRFLSLAPASDRTRPVVEKRITEMQALADAPKQEAPLAAPPTFVSSPAAVPDASGTATLVAQPPAPAPAPEPPLYRRTWFIATCAAVVLVGAVGIWAVSHGSDIPGTPLGNQPAFQ